MGESEKESPENLTEIKPAPDFLREVADRTGQNLSECYQCLKCACGCPLQEEVDLQPNQIVRLIQFGQRDEVLRSRSIWLCVSCQTCTARCPNQVDLAKVMDFLRQCALEAGIAPAEPAVAHFHQAFLDTVRKYGRSHELSLIRRYKFKTGTFFAHLPLGMRMLKKGKIRIIGKRIKQRRAFRRMMDRCRPRG